MNDLNVICILCSFKWINRKFRKVTHTHTHAHLAFFGMLSLLLAKKLFVFGKDVVQLIKLIRLFRVRFGFARITLSVRTHRANPDLRSFDSATFLSRFFSVKRWKVLWNRCNKYALDEMRYVWAHACVCVYLCACESIYLKLWYFLVYFSSCDGNLHNLYDSMKFEHLSTGLRWRDGPHVCVRSCVRVCIMPYYHMN